MTNISNKEVEDILDAKREKGEAKPWAGPASKKYHQLLTGGREEMQNHAAEGNPWLQLTAGIHLVMLREKLSFLNSHFQCNG